MNCSCLDYHFSLHVPDDHLRARVESLFAACEPVATATDRLTILVWARTDRSRQYALYDGTTCIRNTSDADELLATLTWFVNGRAIERSVGSNVLLHAAVAARDGDAVVLAGASGAGKSTLVAALVQAGFDYATDECAAIDLDSGLVRPYPKPITVRPIDALAIESGASPDREVQLTAATLGGTVAAPCRPRAIVFPTFSSGASRCRPIARSDALVRLVEQLSFNLSELRGAGFERLADVVRHCTCWELEHSDLAGAVDAISCIVAGVAPSVRTR